MPAAWSFALWTPVASVLMTNDVAQRCFPFTFQRWTNRRLHRDRTGGENILICRLGLNLMRAEHGDTGAEDEHGGGNEGRTRPPVELRPPAEIHLDDATHDPGLELVPVHLTRRRRVDRAQAARDVFVATVVLSCEIRHMSLRTSLSNRRNDARAWCRSDRAVPSGMPSIEPISP